MSVICPYCGSLALLVNGDVIYPHRPDLSKKKVWLCSPCDAYVGTHENSPKHAPLGRLANAELRSARLEAHAAFDPIWRDGEMTRSEAYQWAADVLGLPKERTHIGMFDVPECKRLIDAVQRGSR